MFYIIYNYSGQHAHGAPRDAVEWCTGAPLCCVRDYERSAWVVTTTLAPAALPKKQLDWTRHIWAARAAE